MSVRALKNRSANAERQRAAVATEMMENKDAEQYLKDLATQLFVMTREGSEDVDCANCEKVLGDGDDAACS